MVQKVTVTEVCDRHYQQGKEVEGDVTIIGIDGVWYAIAGCKTHQAKELDPVRKMCEELGRAIDGNARTHKALLKAALNGAGTASVHALPTAQAAPVVQPAEPVAVAKKVAPSKRKGSDLPRRFFCLWGHEDATYTSSTALLHHLTVEHDTTLTVGDLFGLVCPLCGSDASPKLGFHLFKRHKGVSVCEAFALAVSKGDRHGIARPILAKIPAVS